jgi:imidazolonepropionase-like amidohydrolase
MHRIVATLALVALSSTTFAAERVALVGGTLIDGFGGAPVEDSVVLVEDGRIVETGSAATVRVPDGARVVSTEGMSVLPGLWDMHVHLMLVGHADYAHWDRAYPKRLRDEIMPAAAKQLLHAGVTSARDLGAPLEDSIAVRDAQRSGAIEGPTLYVSGPFIQKAPYPGTEAFRWGVDGADDARRKVQRLCAAGVDIVKLIDQDQMTRAEAQAVVDAAHACGKPVVAHAHRPEEIRMGLAIGVDDFEHTGLSSAPEYPADVMAALAERTASMAKGPLWWTPTIEGLWNYEYVRDHREGLDDPAWMEGLKPDTIADIRGSIAHPERLPYFQLTPLRKPTLAAKFAQLRRAGVVLLIGTDSGIPMKFHSRSTWNEIDVWTRELGVPAMQAIRAATYWPAVAMKVDRDYGTLTPGKWADVIAVRGDVLRYPALLQNVPFVMKHGRVVKDERAAASR